MNTEIERDDMVEEFNETELEELPPAMDDVRDDVEAMDTPVPQTDTPDVTPSITSQGQNIYAMPLGERKPLKTKETRNNNDVLLLKGRISELEEEHSNMLEHIQFLEAENAEMTEELMVKPDVVRDGISNDDVEYLSNLLSSAGVPEILPDGTRMEIGDRIMFIVSQRSIMVTGLQSIRSELTGIAHRARNENSELSQELFNLLKRSSQTTNLIAISDE